MIKIILRVEDEDDLILAVRAAQWMINKDEEQKDAVLVYGDCPGEKAFYVVRNKSSITVRGECKGC